MKRSFGRATAAAFLLANLAACASSSPPADNHKPASTVQVEINAAAFAPETVKVTIHLPAGYEADSTTRYPVLYLNDGQDAAAVGLDDTLARLYQQDLIDKVIVVAIDMPPDRMGTYGLSDRTAQRSRPGWSLGGLNAFNLGWQYPEVFGQVGAFSPSLWLAADRSDAPGIPRSRLAQRMVEAGPKRAGSRFWFAVGTAEETDDRDGDGVIDAVDDTQDLARALVRMGYTANLDYARRRGGGEEVALYLLEGGQHNQDSWSRMLPVFLRWAYGEPDAQDQEGR